MKIHLTQTAIGICYSLYLSCMCTNIVQAQDPIWARTYGGSGVDIANLTIETTDGGYLIAGQSMSNDGDLTFNIGLRDFWIIKTELNGDTAWTRIFGGSLNEYANSIIETSDGGYLIGGATFSNDGDVWGNHGGADCWLVKTDLYGDTMWTKTYGGTGTEWISQILESSDGGYLFTGPTTSNDGDVWGNHGDYDYWLVKTDLYGDTLWTKTYGGTDSDNPNSVIETSDGGYLLAGYATSNDGDVSGNHGDWDCWLVKTDINGDTIWTKTYGGMWEELAYDVIETSDGHYLAVGLTASDDGDISGNHGVWDCLMLKVDPNGNLIWANVYGGSSVDQASMVIETLDGDYVFAGQTNSNDGDVWGNHGDYDYWLVKTDPNGDTLWTRTYGGTTEDIAYSITNTSDNHYLLAGYAISNNGDVSGNHGSHDYWILKVKDLTCAIDTSVSSNATTLTAIDTGGTFQWLDCDLGHAPITNAMGQNYTPASSGNYAVEITKGSCKDTSSCHNFTVVGIKRNIEYGIGIYPNPTTGIITILNIEGTARVYDVYGRLVITSKTNTVDISQEDKGVYFVKIHDKKGLDHFGKLIKK